ncbi:MAG TPA: hypothetical protein VMH84_15130 [Xanthobacteraceae bacterium]|nr:hypothetical protein [Xanthobacteraceae bacterium]
MFLIGVPLLLIPFVIYNAIAFSMSDFAWTQPLPPIHMVSGGEWEMTPGDILIVFSILILFFELVKATRIGMRTIIVHMLSAVLFAVSLVEFLLVKQAATATFFTLLIINFVDMLAGFTISIRTAQRNIEFDSADKITS